MQHHELIVKLSKRLDNMIASSEDENLTAELNKQKYNLRYKSPELMWDFGRGISYILECYCDGEPKDWKRKVIDAWVK